MTDTGGQREHPGPDHTPKTIPKNSLGWPGEKADHKQARQPEGATWTQVPAAPQQERREHPKREEPTREANNCHLSRSPYVQEREQNTDCRRNTASYTVGARKEAVIHIRPGESRKAAQTTLGHSSGKASTSPKNLSRPRSRGHEITQKSPNSGSQTPRKGPSFHKGGCTPPDPAIEPGRGGQAHTAPGRGTAILSTPLNPVHTAGEPTTPLRDSLT